MPIIASRGGASALGFGLGARISTGPRLYFAGGWSEGTGAYTSSIDALNPSNDARTTLTATLSAAYGYSAPFSSTTNGYVAGGSSGSNRSAIDKFTFASETVSTSSTTLSSARYGAAGFQSSTAGYVAGGNVGPSGSNDVSTVDKILFSNESRSTLGTGLGINSRHHAGFSSSTSGYVAGGFNGGGTNNRFGTVYKFAFSNDARSTTTSMTRGRHSPMGFNSTVAGYIAGGNDDYGAGQVNVTEIYKMLFSNDSISTLSATLSVGSATDSEGVANATIAYIQIYSPNLDKLLFSNDTRTTVTNGLPATMYARAGIGAAVA